MLNSPVTFVVDNILSPQDCADIIELGKQGHKADDIVINDKNEIDKNVRNTELYFFSDNSVYEKIMPHVERLNAQVGWNYSYCRVEPLQLGIYNEGGHYDWHSDDSAKPYGAEAGVFAGLYRKLSFSILLNDDFDGGEFEIVHNMPARDVKTKKINISQGSVILFPSFTPHKVHPVTKRTRMSLVGWCCGESWK